MEDSCLRQRRNLMIISIVVFLISFAEIKLGGKGSISNFNYTIENIIYLYIMIGIMHVYFLLRYFQEFLIVLKDEDFGLVYFPTWKKNSQEPIFYGHFIIVLYKILRNTIVFLIEFTFVLIFGFKNLLIEKKYSEYIFPLIFSVIIGISSWNASFIEIKKQEAKPIYDELVDNTYGVVVNSVNNTIEEYTIIINDKYKSLVGKNLFDDSKSIKIKYIN